MTSGRVSCVHDQRGEVEAHPSLEGRRNPGDARQIRLKEGILIS